ncbi:electron transfer flavoprotein subunit alpha/FixB family protein [Neisseriaceae bacterium PsAf]|nr:electron transfer flavoprotein subunit alpha/FixB family protein [Neisseriaceae bacterium PsAf]MCV2503347.1 FAD-binding protein [Neisseriaceae bacterium]
MSVLVIAEISENQLAPATLNTVTAAKQLGEVDVLVAGANTDTVAKEASEIEGVNKVLVADASHYENQLAEEMAVLIQSLAEPYQYIMAAANTFGKNILPRVAALLDVTQVSDVSEIVDESTFIHPIYAGNAFQKVKTKDAKVVLTIRATQFDASNTGGSASTEKVSTPDAVNLSRFVKREISKSDRPELTQAKVVVSGGRGLGSKENFETILPPLADLLNAAIGASRAAVDAGYAPNDYQVGQTGKIVAPELYIAIGISGAIQHLAGMQDSKVIVAINKDADAPIFNIATYGLVADLFEAVPELVEALK